MQHTSRQLQPVRQDVTDLDALTSVSQEGADPPDNDVRQTQCNQLGYENVVVDVNKCISEIDEDSAYRLFYSINIVTVSLRHIVSEISNLTLKPGLRVTLGHRN